jgi:hypothetical protein
MIYPKSSGSSVSAINRRENAEGVRELQAEKGFAPICPQKTGENRLA